MDIKQWAVDSGQWAVNRLVMDSEQRECQSSTGLQFCKISISVNLTLFTKLKLGEISAKFGKMRNLKFRQNFAKFRWQPYPAASGNVPVYKFTLFFCSTQITTKTS